MNKTIDQLGQEMSAPSKRRAGAPRGNKNAAKPTLERRVALSTSITRETKRELLRRAREAGTSTGRVIDALMW